MRLRFAKLNPAGNTTILVLDPVLEPMHAEIAANLMNPAVLGGEQVGFVTLMAGGPIAASIRMMGGEFCGNAARSLGAYLASVRHSAMRIMKDSDSLVEGLIQVHGVDEPVLVQAKLDKEEMPFWASCAFPGVPEVDFYFVETLSWTSSGPGRNICVLPCLNPRDLLESWLGEIALKIRPTVVALVRLEGITHIVVDARDYRMEEHVLLELGEAFDLEDEPCIGVIFRRGLDEIVPLVHVAATNTFVWESSCASGSVAVALAYAAALGEPGCYDFKQPGGTLSVTVTPPNAKGEPAAAYATVSGDVRIVAEGTVFIDTMLVH
jgi:diaminopimelate epimerase